MEETKTVTISGAAAESIGGELKKKPRKTRKSKGGDPEKTPTLTSTQELPPAGVISPLTITKVGGSPFIHSLAPPQPASTSSLLSASSSPLVQDGGDRKIRVELKKKPHRKTVHLHPKKPEAQKVPLKKIQTKKNRKVLLGVSSMHKRMTRAKKVHTKIKEMPLDKLKALLISKKLIKATSKAPESVLRQIAVDADIVAQNAL